ncbi:APH domain-containing protein [Mycena kentingensis (nom. inval.)]|nr:APH domain-containing protein [Mycena kentingensis (nom. inval.)]
MAELDLAEASDVLKYLSSTPFASSRVEMLSGGNANYTYRLFLEEPSSASGGFPTVVMKHSKAWSRTSRSFELKIARQEIEAFALQRVRAILDAASPSIVTVPTVFLYDPTHAVIIMEDAGENSETLKSLLRRTSLLHANLTQLCADLGRFLATIHNHGSADAELMSKVGTNEQMRWITAWITYEGVLPILKGEGPYAGVVSPALDLPSADLERLASLCKTRIAQVYAAADTFTMGDFWTGNVICRLNPLSGQVEKAFVVDWEVAKPGVPFLDWGQLAAELYTIGCFHPARAAEIGVGLDAYGRAYRDARESGVDEEFVRGAESHVGAHLAVITPTVTGWGTKEEVREVVKKGTEFMLKGLDGDIEWLKTSVVSGLAQ